MSTNVKISFFGEREFNYRAQRFLKMNSKSSSLAIYNVKSMSFLVIQPLTSKLNMVKKSIRESMLPTANLAEEEVA